MNCSSPHVHLFYSTGPIVHVCVSGKRLCLSTLTITYLSDTSSSSFIISGKAVSSNSGLYHPHTGPDPSPKVNDLTSWWRHRAVPVTSMQSAEDTKVFFSAAAAGSC